MIAGVRELLRRRGSARSARGDACGGRALHRASTGWCVRAAAAGGGRVRAPGEHGAADDDAARPQHHDGGAGRALAPAPHDVGHRRRLRDAAPPPGPALWTQKREFTAQSHQDKIQRRYKKLKNVCSKI